MSSKKSNPDAGSLRRWHAIAVVVVLVTYLMASLGWMPSADALSRLTGVVMAERYACESCGCGCSSAHECWTQCCCHTLEERVAWARREGVKIPSYVDLSELRASSSNAQSVEPACSLCVAAERDRHTQNESRTPKASISALACKGLSSVLGLAAIPGVWSGRLDVELPPLQRNMPRVTSDVLPASRTLTAPTPPPRLV